MKEKISGSNNKAWSIWQVDINRSNILFYISYAVWLSMNILVDSAYEGFAQFAFIFRCTNIFCILLIGIQAISRKMYVKKIPILFLCGLSVLASAFLTGQLRIIFIFLFVYCAGEISDRDLIKFSFIIECILMVWILGSFCIGILPNETITRTYGFKRYFLGYNYATLSANYFFHMVMMYLFLKKEKLNKVSGAVIMLINILFFCLTDTKAVFALVILLLILVCVGERRGEGLFKNKNLCKILSYIFVWTPILAICLIISFRWGSAFCRLMNRVLTNRLSLGRQAYEAYGISLLGQNITWNMDFDGEYLYVDCAYMNIAVNFGIVMLGWLCAGMTCVAKEAVRRKNTILCMILLILGIHSITDPQLYMLWYNPFLLLMGKYFTDKEGEFILAYRPGEVLAYVQKALKKG